MGSAPTELLFVYNADATLAGMVTDFAHRTLRPDTYECNLCDLTYNRVTKKRTWRRFLSDLPLPCSFTLRDRFRKQFPKLADTPMPAVFVRHGDGHLELLVPADQIQAATSLDELEGLVARAVGLLELGG